MAVGTTDFAFLPSALLSNRNEPDLHFEEGRERQEIESKNESAAESNTSRAWRRFQQVKPCRMVLLSAFCGLLTTIIIMTRLMLNFLEKMAETEELWNVLQDVTKTAVSDSLSKYINENLTSAESRSENESELLLA